MLILSKNLKSSIFLLNTASRMSWETSKLARNDNKQTYRLKSSSSSSASSPRFNEIGVQMIDEKLREYLFKGCKFSQPDEAVVQRVREHLKNFKLDPDSTSSKDGSKDQIKDVPSKQNLNLFI